MNDGTLLEFRKFVNTHLYSSYASIFIINLLDEVIRLRCQYENMIDPEEILQSTDYCLNTACPDYNITYDDNCGGKGKRFDGHLCINSK